jgi:hypothetical protein
MDVEVLALKNPLLVVFVYVLTLASGTFAQSVRLLDDPGGSLADRFGRVPLPGVHPRVLIGPKELITLRQLVQTTEAGQHVLTAMENHLNALLTPGKELATVYEGLIKGDKGSLSNAPNDWLRKHVPFVLAMECYDVMLRQDEKRGRQVASALVTLASIPRNQGEDTDVMNLALSYDFDYPYMTEDQRAIIRQGIASTTAGKIAYGSNAPADWNDYNWIPRATTLLLSALAIEGEKGYDSSIYPASQKVMKDFLHYGITGTGGGLEEMHYFHYGMDEGALAMVAFARHGDDLFAEPHYRALPNWLIASIEPFGNAFTMHQDSTNDQGGEPGNYVILKWTWPADPVVDMIWKNYVQVGYQNLNGWDKWLPVLLFPSDPKAFPSYTGRTPQTKWGIDETAIPANYPDPVAGIDALHLPLSYWDPQRGLLITRDKWGDDGMVLNFDINTQANGGGSHYHSNSTMFTFSALRRKWAIERGFHIVDTKDNSLILIDGRGQGYYPIGGTTAEYREDADLTVIAGDASDPYHWMTRNQQQLGAPYLKGFQWEPDTRGENLRRYGELVTANKNQPWKEKQAAAYVFRASYNPVEKAFRTVALRRGGHHSYVLILDDIRKDNNKHQYDWLMQVPDDLIITGSRDHGVILGSADPKDKRRLIVQMIDVKNAGSWVLENYEVKRSPETGDTTSYGMGKRLRYSVQAIEPDFKVLLYPYREGSAVPEITLNGPIELTWTDQKDSYNLTTLPTGRTAIHLHGSM